jgi:hypothetical protein
MDILEKLLAEGRITRYDVDREKNRVTMGIWYWDTDCDGPYETCGHGEGPTFAAALRQATRNMPDVVIL